VAVSISLQSPSKGSTSRPSSDNIKILINVKCGGTLVRMKNIYDIMNQGTPVWCCSRTGSIVTVNEDKIVAWKPSGSGYEQAGERLVSFGDEFLYLGEDGEDILLEAARKAAEDFYREEINP
jgi:hypothetical protein